MNFYKKAFQNENSTTTSKQNFSTRINIVHNFIYTHLNKKKTITKH